MEDGLDGVGWLLLGMAAAFVLVGVLIGAFVL